MAKKPIPLPVEAVEPSKEEECPKCPPPGAPAWMATFADIAILLMAFFVLILSFAEFNQPKFKMIAGSLKAAFGVQREIPVVEQPRGTTVLELKFSPSPDPSVTRTLRQDTTQIEQPKIKSDVDEKQKREAEQKTPEEIQEEKDEQKRQLAELLKDVLEQGQLKANMENGQMTLEYDPNADPQDPAESSNTAPNSAESMEPSQDANEDRYPSLLTDAEKKALRQDGNMVEDSRRDGMPDTQDAYAQDSQAATELTEQELMAELVEQLNALAQNALEADTVGDAAAAGAANHPEGIDGIDDAAIAADRLAVALRQELGEGLVSVEQRDDKVFVTVGAGGAFPSGTADLTYEARTIMDRIAFAAMNDASQITVTGHTDNVPLSGGTFRDNWGLAAARASSVVRELAASGLIDPTRLTATSMGETSPVADNSTAEGRSQNRRIEIEISY